MLLLIRLWIYNILNVFVHILVVKLYIFIAYIYLWIYVCFYTFLRMWIYGYVIIWWMNFMWICMVFIDDEYSYTFSCIYRHVRLVYCCILKYFCIRFFNVFTGIYMDMVMMTRLAMSPSSSTSLSLETGCHSFRAVLCREDEMLWPARSWGNLKRCNLDASTSRSRGKRVRMRRRRPRNVCRRWEE